MKQKFRYREIVLFAFSILATLTSFAQQQFNITSSKENNYCNSTCTQFNVPDLNGNPNAIIFITPVEGNGAIKDPHPICAYYNGKLWSVMNTDNASMPVGAQFSVQYYANPDDTHFVHVVTKENLAVSNSYIDHAGLNGNPNAKFQLFQNVAPNVRGGLMNTNEIKTQYDQAAGKWFIANSNGKILDVATGYNISISTGTTPTLVNTTPANITPFSPGPKIDNSGERVFMTVLGKTQGQFTGENPANRIEITDFATETISPRDLVSGMASGKRQHAPVIIQKATAPNSIQFFNAITNNELLTTVTFDVYKPTLASGVPQLYYSIKLTNASISYFQQSFNGDQRGFMDSIKIVYQTIELSFANLGIIAVDNWQIN